MCEIARKIDTINFMCCQQRKVKGAYHVGLFLPVLHQ